MYATYVMYHSQHADDTKLHTSSRGMMRGSASS